VGLKRKINEDSLLMAPDFGLYLVADGMGGHKAGDVASRMTAKTIQDYWQKMTEGNPPPFLEEIDRNISLNAKHLLNSIFLANRIVYEAQKKPQYHRMGSTLAALLLEDNSVWVANVGDSLIYLFYDDQLRQVSESHSLESEQKNLGMIDPEEAGNSLFRHILTRAIGLRERVDVFITAIEPKPGATILLCSDGLTDYTSEENIKTVLDDFTISLERKVDVLIDEAKRGGGGDNITVLLVEILEQGKWDKFKKRLKF